jgi:hypothetical protein
LIFPFLGWTNIDALGVERKLLHLGFKGLLVLGHKPNYFPIVHELGFGRLDGIFDPDDGFRKPISSFLEIFLNILWM